MTSPRNRPPDGCSPGGLLGPSVDQCVRCQDPDRVSAADPLRVWPVPALPAGLACRGRGRTTQIVQRVQREHPSSCRPNERETEPRKRRKRESRTGPAGLPVSVQSVVEWMSSSPFLAPPAVAVGFVAPNTRQTGRPGKEDGHVLAGPRGLLGFRLRERMFGHFYRTSVPLRRENLLFRLCTAGASR